MKLPTRPNGFRSPYRSKLILMMLIIALVPITILGSLSYKTTYNTLHQHVDNHVEQIMLQTNGILKEYFNKLHNMMDLSVRLPGLTAIAELENEPDFELYATHYDNPFAAMDGFKHRDIQLAKEFMRRLNEEADIQASYFATVNGNLYTESSQHFHGASSDYTPVHESWYEVAMKHKGSTMWSRPRFQEQVNDATITLSQSVTANGQVSGVFAMDISAANMIDKLQSIELQHEGYLSVIDAQGTYLIHPDTAKIGTKVSDQHLLQLLTLRYAAQYKTNDEVYHFVTNPSNGWKIMVTFSSKDLYREVNQIRDTTLALSGAVLVFTLLFSMGTAQLAIGPVERFVEHIQRITQGELDAPLPRDILTRKDDLGQMARSMEKMQDHIGTLIDDMQDMNKDMLRTQKDLVYKLGEIAETRSQETGYHVKRVAEYSKLLAQYCGFDEWEAEHLKIASTLHDVGKLGVPDSILLKPGKLTDEEFDTIRAHTTIGHELLRHSNQSILQQAALISLYHHEKYNGTGYPMKLRGSHIPLPARIVALADVFDAVGTQRIYKDAWPLEDILALIRRERGEQFDPQLVDIFFEHLDAFLAVRERLSDLPGDRTESRMKMKTS